MKTILYWFKQDLRLHDMQGLYAIDSQNRLLPIYVFDPRQNMHTEYGFPKMGKRRLCFLEQSVLALQQYLRSSGSDLLIFEGKPEEIIPKLIDLYAIHAIHTEKDIAPEEIQVQSAIQEQIHIPIIEKSAIERERERESAIERERERESAIEREREREDRKSVV